MPNILVTIWTNKDTFVENKRLASTRRPKKPENDHLSEEVGLGAWQHAYLITLIGNVQPTQVLIVD